MMKIKFLLPILIIVPILFGGYVVLSGNNSQTEEVSGEDVHYHAAFNVYKNDELVDFAELKYMHVEPCGTEPEEHAEIEGDEQIEKAHLHDLVGDVVHVHRPNAYWKDLFKNINFVFDGSIKGYVDGVEVEDILNLEIKADSRALFIEGEINDLEKKLEAIPDVDYIRSVEAKSESLCS